MADGLVSTGRRIRRWRTASEKLAIVQLTLSPGASVAEVARAQGMNANQLFKWRRAFERGELSESSVALIPVKVSNSAEERRAPEVVVPPGGAIHIELPGRAVGDLCPSGRRDLAFDHGRLGRCSQ
jgi:transposase